MSVGCCVCFILVTLLRPPEVREILQNWDVREILQNWHFEHFAHLTQKVSFVTAATHCGCTDLHRLTLVCFAAKPVVTKHNMQDSQIFESLAKVYEVTCIGEPKPVATWYVETRKL